MRIFFLPCAIFPFTFTAVAAQRQTAFQAYANLPRDAALHLVRIAACEGAPQPTRWHFVIHEAEMENGFRDYVIAAGQVASVNGVSQFVDEVRVEDVLALNSVKVDSGYVAQVAKQYGAANSAILASLNYELYKDAVGKPVWKATCLDASDRVLGWLTIDAGDGRVVQQSGFETVPVLRSTVATEPAIGEEKSASPAGGLRRPPPPTSSADDSLPPERPPRQVEVRRAEAIEKPPPQRRGIVIDLFRPGRKPFPF